MDPTSAIAATIWLNAFLEFKVLEVCSGRLKHSNNLRVFSNESWSGVEMPRFSFRGGLKEDNFMTRWLPLGKLDQSGATYLSGRFDLPSHSKSDVG